MMKSRTTFTLIVILMALQLLLVLLSWVLSALYPQLQLHSLLSGEGLRWAFRNLASSRSMPLLPSIVLLSVAVGLLAGSGLLQRSHRRRFFTALLLLALLLVVAGYLSWPALLTPTGRFFAGSLVQGVLPLLALVMAVFSLVGGYAAGTYRSPADAVRTIVRSMAMAAPLILLYMLAAQLWNMLQFVF